MLLGIRLRLHPKTSDSATLTRTDHKLHPLFESRVPGVWRGFNLYISILMAVVWLVQTFGLPPNKSAANALTTRPMSRSFVWTTYLKNMRLANCCPNRCWALWSWCKNAPRWGHWQSDEDKLGRNQLCSKTWEKMTSYRIVRLHLRCYLLAHLEGSVQSLLVQFEYSLAK